MLEPLRRTGHFASELTWPQEPPTNRRVFGRSHHSRLNSNGSPFARPEGERRNRRAWLERGRAEQGGDCRAILEEVQEGSTFQPLGADVQELPSCRVGANDRAIGVYLQTRHRHPFEEGTPRRIDRVKVALRARSAEFRCGEFLEEHLTRRQAAFDQLRRLLVLASALSLRLRCARPKPTNLQRPAPDPGRLHPVLIHQSLACAFCRSRSSIRPTVAIEHILEGLNQRTGEAGFQEDSLAADSPRGVRVGSRGVGRQQDHWYV